MKTLAASLLAVLFAVPTGVSATELVGKPIRVNPAEDPVNSIYDARVVDDEGGGFGVVWSKRIDDDDFYLDNLYARFYTAKLKATGPRVRFDGKVGRHKPIGVYFTQPVHLGGGSILAPWNGAVEGGAYTPYAGQVFIDQKPVGKAEILERDYAFSKDAIKLSGGRAMLIWNRASRDEAAGQIVEADGSLGKTLAFTETYTYGEYPNPLKTGFFRSIVSCVQPMICTKVQVFDDEGNREGAQFMIGQGDSVSTYGFPGALGLQNDTIAAISFSPLAQQGHYKVSAQLFTRQGAKIGQPAVLIDDVAGRGSTIALADAGFLLTTAEGNADGSATMSFYRFDSKLKQQGRKASTIWPADRITFRPVQLTDGRVVAGYVGNHNSVMVQVIEP